MNLNSKKYPDITYEKGEEIFLTPDKFHLPFYFDVEAELTEKDDTMTFVANALDELEKLEQTAKDFLKSALLDEKNECHATISYFMEFHQEEDVSAELFPVDDPSTLSFSEMVNFLQVKRFGSLVDAELGQAFIMDLSFNPEITDELMVVYFNLSKQVVYVTHES